MTSSAPFAVFEETYLVRAPRDRVFRALTTGADMHVWFAEHAHVEPRVGGAYTFRGRHTPTFGGPDQADQRITAIEPGRVLAFTWTWSGCPTRCRLELADAPGGATSISIRQELGAGVGGFDATDSGWVCRDFWQLAVGNLDCFLRTGKPAILPDHSPGVRDGRAGDVVLSIEIDAPAQRVWDAITRPEEMIRWLARDKDFGLQPRVELRVGGAYTYGWEKDGKPIGPVKILEIEPGRRLVHSWNHAADATNRTEWTIEPLGPSRSRLSVRQIGTGSPKEFSGYSNGWASFLLAIGREAAG